MISKEFSILEKRAKSGNVKAQYELGDLYFTDYGKEVKKYIDRKTAFAWVTENAEQSDADAQYLLGVLYLMAVWLNDPEKPLYWFTKSAENGNKEAQEQLKEL